MVSYLKVKYQQKDCHQQVESNLQEPLYLDPHTMSIKKTIDESDNHCQYLQFIHYSEITLSLEIGVNAGLKYP